MVHSKSSFWAYEAPVSASSYDQQLGYVSADNDLNIWPGIKRRDPIGNLLKVGKLSYLGDVCTLDEKGSFFILPVMECNRTPEIRCPDFFFPPQQVIRKYLMFVPGCI